MSISEEEIAKLKSMANTIRKDILKMVYTAKAGHPGGSLSATDITTVLFFHFMRVDPKNPDWEERDRFILSKGHACPVLYAALSEKGYFPRKELLTLRQIDGRLQGHPDMKKTPGVDMTSGSLGQGLSAAIGMALGLKLDRRDSSVYVLLSDGELDEGQIWEAAMAAAKYELDNLVAIVDHNRLQLDGWCNEVMPTAPLVDKWQAFGWEVFEANGHDIRNIVETIEKARQVQGRPCVIIAHTVKGKGVSFMENECDWHGRAPNKEQFEQAMSELDQELDA